MISARADPQLGVALYTQQHTKQISCCRMSKNILNGLIAILSARLMKLLDSSRSCTVLFLLTTPLWCALVKASESVVISSENEIEADAFSVVCENRERQKEVVKLFGKMGA